MNNLLNKFDNVKEKKEKTKEKTKSSKKEIVKVKFDDITNTSEFKRLVYMIWFGKAHRKSNEDLEKQLSLRKKEIKFVSNIDKNIKEILESSSIKKEEQEEIITLIKKHLESI